MFTLNSVYVGSMLHWLFIYIACTVLSTEQWTVLLGAATGRGRYDVTMLTVSPHFSATSCCQRNARLCGYIQTHMEGKKSISPNSHYPLLSNHFLVLNSSFKIAEARLLLLSDRSLDYLWAESWPWTSLMLITEKWNGGLQSSTLQ